MSKPEYLTKVYNLQTSFSKNGVKMHGKYIPTEHPTPKEDEQEEEVKEGS